VLQVKAAQYYTWFFFVFFVNFVNFVFLFFSCPSGPRQLGLVQEEGQGDIREPADHERGMSPETRRVSKKNFLPLLPFYFLSNSYSIPDNTWSLSFNVRWANQLYDPNNKISQLI